jgi:hypothetical protein
MHDGGETLMLVCSGSAAVVAWLTNHQPQLINHQQAVCSLGTTDSSARSWLGSTCGVVHPLARQQPWRGITCDVLGRGGGGGGCTALTLTTGKAACRQHRCKAGALVDESSHLDIHCQVQLAHCRSRGVGKLGKRDDRPAAMMTVACPPGNGMQLVIQRSRVVVTKLNTDTAFHWTLDDITG